MKNKTKQSKKREKKPTDINKNKHKEYQITINLMLTCVLFDYYRYYLVVLSDYQSSEQRWFFSSDADQTRAPIRITPTEPSRVSHFPHSDLDDFWFGSGSEFGRRRGSVGISNSADYSQSCCGHFESNKLNWFILGIFHGCCQT